MSRYSNATFLILVQTQLRQECRSTAINQKSQLPPKVFALLLQE